MDTFKNLPLATFPTSKGWQDWLRKHYAQPDGVWVKFAKKGSGETTLTYEQAREAALMYGWIDGLTNGLDEKFYTIRFTPRRPKGTWSKINREIAEGLIAAGKMQASGLAAIEAAKADGRWDAAYDGQATIAVPDDFKEALSKDPVAFAFFSELNKTNRYAVLWRIQTAAKAETRAARIKKLVSLLHDGKVSHAK